jgi:tetratricopeptide (TPR) repeat protein
MSKLADVFVEWAKQKKRRPLLLLLLIPVIFKLTQDYYALSFRDTANHSNFWIPSGALIILSGCLYAYFSYYERIRYSMLFDRLRGGPRVVLSDAVAWQVLKYSTPAGETSRTIADELASLLSGLPYHVSVVKERELAKFEVTERDGFIVEGMGEGLGFLLKTGMTFNVARIEKLIENSKEDLEPGDKADNVPVLPAKRYLKNQFLHLRAIETPLTFDSSEEHRTTMARLLLRYALASMLYLDGNSEASRVFEEILTIGNLLPVTKSAPLAKIFKTTGYYLAVCEQKIEEALQALAFAHTFAPEDSEINIMRTYLFLISKGPERAKELVEQLAASPGDPAACLELRGAYFFITDRYEEAIAAYEAAIPLESDDSYSSMVHLGAALAYGMSTHAEARTRGTEMIKHLEDAIHLFKAKKKLLYPLQGYAWALRGDAEQSRKAFEQAVLFAKTDEDQKRLVYWRAKSALMLEQYAEGAEDIKRLMGDPATCRDGDLLLMYADCLLSITGREMEVEKCADRAIELKADAGRAYYLKGFALANRMRNLPTSEVAQRRQFSEDAKSYLLKSIRLGNESAAIHIKLSGLYYKEDADPVNAEKHNRRACELDPENVMYLILWAEVLMACGDFAAARNAFAKTSQIKPEDSDLYLMEGTLWQMAGRMADAEKAYVNMLRICPNSYSGNDNLAYVLFDLQRVDEALKHWEKALEIRPNDPDALAGKALVLKEKGEHMTALALYRSAVEQNSSFLNAQILREEFLWSESACMAAQPLIEKLKSQEHE